MFRAEFHLYCMRPVTSEVAAEMQLSFLDAFKDNMVDVVPNGKRVTVNIYGHEKTSKQAVSDVAKRFDCEVFG